MTSKLQLDRKAYQNNEGAVKDIEDAVESLRRLKVIEFLRTYRARPLIVEQGGNVHKNVMSAGMSAGYHQCLDDLENFRDSFVVEKTSQPIGIKPSYGGTELAESRGDLTKEEAHDRRKTNN